MYQIDFNKPIHIHFIGIGGISMSGLAELLLSENFKISGSDNKESALTRQLSDAGCNIFIGQKADNIDSSVDACVYTAAIHPDNPEYARCQELGIPMLSRAELLGQIMKNYRTAIGVSGTHGKTTTSSMLSEIMLQADKNPTITIGGNLSTIHGNINVGSNEYFVAEACEYHDSFLQFYPYVAVILNIEAEHLDYFKGGIDQIRQSFHTFASNVPAGGYVVINSADEGFDVITNNLKADVVSFGMDKAKSDWYPENIDHSENGKASFDAYFKGEFKCRIELNVPGDHNILNALAACAASVCTGVDIAHIKQGLKNYTGVDRRFQYKGEFNGITVIDDYAHHPSEVKATLAAAKNVKHNKIWCLFQPHTYSRAKTLLPQFGTAFYDADKVVLADIYAAREKDTGIISSKDVVDEINKNSKNAVYGGSFEKIKEIVLKEAVAGDIVITMGAGDIYKVGEELLK